MTINKVLIVFYILNAVAVLLMIFKERKKPEVIISWSLLFSFLPLIGFVLYVLIGSGLSLKNRQMLKKKRYYTDNYSSIFYKHIKEKPINVSKKVGSVIKFNMSNAGSLPTFGNDVQFFSDGKEKISALLKDIKNAKETINLEYYIFGDDEIGKAVRDALVEKAKQGVCVNLIFDSVGSLKTRRLFFNKLKKAGGHVKEFFPPLFHIRLINLKLNYRNHRKIAVIDGKIAYLGGINLRKDHCGLNKKLSPWCDAHLRITGHGVYPIQNEFLNFWQFCTHEKIENNKEIHKKYFPYIEPKGNTVLQVVSCGPENKEKSFIKETIVKMINCAEQEIIWQTPYFVPDDVVMSAIKTAIASGVRFKLIMPGKPDKKIVYNASLSFAEEVIKAGGEVFLFDGFMHAKALVIDDDIITIGTANADQRSFELNFEINAVLFDKSLVLSYKKHIDFCLMHSKKINITYFKQSPLIKKITQLFFRLFAPLL